MKTTTLNKIKNCQPHKSMWDNLLKGLEKTEADDEPLPYAKILEICGLHDAIWATCTEYDFWWVKDLAVKYVRRVAHLMKDSRLVVALDVAEQFLRGEIDRKELDRAWVEVGEAYRACDTEDKVAVYSVVTACCTISIVSFSGSAIPNLIYQPKPR